MPNPHFYASHVVSLIGAPGETPISLAEAKSFMRVDHSEDDTLIALLINAAVSHVDGIAGILGRALIAQEWQMVVPYDDAPGGTRKLYLPVLSARELTGLSYYDTSNTLVTANLSDFDLVANSSWAYVLPKNDADWPEFYDRHDALTVEWRAGFGDAVDIPPAIKAALLLIVSDLYRNRETVVIGATTAKLQTSATVDALLSPFRLVGV